MRPLPLVLLFALSIIQSCTKNSDPAPAINIDKTSAELYYDQSHEFKLMQGISAVDPSTYTWASSNQYTGTVSSKGAFTAKHVGKTTITAVSKSGQPTLSCEVTIKPYSTLFREPLTKYQATGSEIMKYETRARFATSATGIIFKGEHSRLNYVIYSLNNDKNTSTAVTFPTNTDNAKEVATFMKERYNLISYQNSIYQFSDNSSLNIGLTVDATLGLVLIYIPDKQGGRIGNAELNRVLQSLTIPVSE